MKTYITPISAVISIFSIIIMPDVCFAQYDSYQRNLDGTYVCGGCYDSYQRNPDGTYVCGGNNFTGCKKKIGTNWCILILNKKGGSS